MRSALALLCVFVFSCASVAQSGQSSWRGLGGLNVGQKIQIIETNSKKHTASFVSVTDSAITFTEGSAERSLQKVEVRSVKLHGHRRMRNALIGAGAGGGLLAVLGAVSCNGKGGFLDPGRGYCAGIMGAFGAIIGAPIGALIPTENTIYLAESHKSPRP